MAISDGFLALRIRLRFAETFRIAQQAGLMSRTPLKGRSTCSTLLVSEESPYQKLSQSLLKRGARDTKILWLKPLGVLLCAGI
jgi:hypothetical protein